MTTPIGEDGNGSEGSGEDGSGQPAPKPGEQQPTPRTFSQEDFNRFEAKTKREYREKAEKDAELIELGRTAQEALNAKRPLEERVATLTAAEQQAKTDAEAARLESKRYKLAATAGLDPLLWDRVRGGSEDEILADIETLKPLSTSQANPGNGGGRQGPKPNGQQGNPGDGNGDGKTGSIAGGRDLFAQRHGKKSENAAT